MKKPYQRTLWLRRFVREWREAIEAGLLRREVPELERIPWWMGIAYRRWDCLTTVCYVVPLNWVVHLLREAWWRLKRPGYPGVGYSRLDRLQAAAYDDGWRRGYAAAVRESEPGYGKPRAEAVGPGPTATGDSQPSSGGGAEGERLRGQSKREVVF